MALHGYIVEEIAEDFSEGLLTRREALRRLGLLGLSVTGAAATLAACAGDDDDKKVTTTSPTATSPSTSAGAPGAPDAPGAAGALKADAIKFAGPAGQLQGAFSAAKTAKGAVLVVHENRGLTSHFFDVSGRLAAAGYSALAVDLLSRRGGTAAVGDEGAAQAFLGQAPAAEVVADLRAGIDELERRAPDEKIGAVGFCFGGGMVWNLLNAGESRLAAAAPFYGTPPEPADFSKAKAAVFAVYGATDSRVNATHAAAEAAVDKAGLRKQFKTFAGAGHAFFNDTNPQRYNATAANEAWSTLLAWFNTYL